jgi:hypothetical protein
MEDAINRLDSLIKRRLDRIDSESESETDVGLGGEFQP